MDHKFVQARNSANEPAAWQFVVGRIHARPI